MRQQVSTTLMDAQARADRWACESLPPGYRIMVLVDPGPSDSPYRLDRGEWEALQEGSWPEAYRDFFRRLTEQNRPCPAPNCPFDRQALADINDRIKRLGLPYRVEPYYGETKRDAVWADLFWLRRLAS